jgi:hypothetical protein
MSTTPKRRPSTLSASKFVASQMPLGATPDPRANARPEPAPMTGAGRSSANANANTKAPGNAPKVTWGSVHGRSPDNRNSPLLQGASAFSMPGTVAFKEVMRKSAATNAAAAASASAAAAAAKAASVKKAPAARARTAAPSGARNRQDSIVVTSLIVAFLLIAVSVASVQVSGGMSTERSKTAISSTLSVVHEQQTAFRTLNQRFATWSELSNSGMTLGPRQAVVSSNATASHWFMAVRDSSTGVVCSRTGELFDTGPDERRAACSESTL